MHSEDACSFHQGYCINDGRTVERLIGSTAKQLVDHRLAGHSYQQGQLEHLQFLQFAHQLIVLLLRLSEAEAWVKDNILHPEVAQLLHLLGEAQQHLPQRRLHRH